MRSLGKNVYAYKMQALILGGVIGAPRRHHRRPRRSRRCSPTSSAPTLTFFAYTVADPRRRGPGARPGRRRDDLLGSCSASSTASSTEAVRPSRCIPDVIMNANQAGQVRFILVGLALMLLMIFRPQGIFGDRKELALDAR